jgi:HEAT repeat protein
MSAIRRASFLLAILAAFAGPASPRTLRSEAVALGHQTERADLVALGARRSADPAVFTLTETIRGDVASGESVTVLVPADEAPGWPAGVMHLLFLRRLPGDETVFMPVAGEASVVAVSEGPAMRWPDVVRRLAATFESPERPDEPRERLSLLLDLMEDADPGLAWSAALDFTSWEELHGLLTAGDRARVLAAFSGREAGKRDKEALAMAVGTARPAGALDGLLDGLDPAGGTSLRGTIGDALARLADPATGARIAERIAKAAGPARADLLALLGAAGGGEVALAAARRHVVDALPAVRQEAAHALGRIARRIRQAEPGTVVEGRTELVGLLSAANSDAERKAALWGLAQLDDPEAFALLRRLSEEDPREFVRRTAKLYLTRPRLTLTFD